MVAVELLSKRVALLAGEAIRAVPGATAVDAIVMASAAQRGDVVYTSAPEQLRSYFPGVLVLRA
ncbi:MAG TPA: hypothetical protein VFX59_14225 [Polyangiales bacterium]|nr:hypothetical protein [Polyangiales bacterium]